MQSTEQVGARLREPYKGPALVQHQPTVGGRQVQASLVFGWRDFFDEQERPVDLFEIRPFCTASTVLAISTILRAAFSESE